MKEHPPEKSTFCILNKYSLAFFSNGKKSSWKFQVVSLLLCLPFLRRRRDGVVVGGCQQTYWIDTKVANVF